MNNLGFTQLVGGERCPIMPHPKNMRKSIRSHPQVWLKTHLIIDWSHWTDSSKDFECDPNPRNDGKIDVGTPYIWHGSNSLLSHQPVVTAVEQHQSHRQGSRSLKAQGLNHDFHRGRHSWCQWTRSWSASPSPTCHKAPHRSTMASSKLNRPPRAWHKYVLHLQVASLHRNETYLK